MEQHEQGAGHRLDLRPARPNCVDLPRDRALRDLHEARDPEALRGPGEGEAVVPRADRRDAPSALLLRQTGEAIPRPADLEHAEALEVLELQVQLLGGISEGHRRGATCDLADEGQGGLDLPQADSD